MTSGQTRKGGRLAYWEGQAGRGDTIGAKENPAGVNLRGLVGVPMSIAREGGENEKESEEEAQGEVPQDTQ